MQFHKPAVNFQYAPSAYAILHNFQELYLHNSNLTWFQQILVSI